MSSPQIDIFDSNSSEGMVAFIIATLFRWIFLFLFTVLAIMSLGHLMNGGQFFNDDFFNHYQGLIFIASLDIFSLFVWMVYYKKAFELLKTSFKQESASKKL